MRFLPRPALFATIGASVLAVAAAVLVAALAGASPYTLMGLADPGAVVRIGTPLLRLVADASATLCVGAFVFAVFFTRPEGSGRLSVDAYAAVLWAGRWAVLWAAAAVALVPFTAANLSGLPLSGRAVTASPARLFALWATMEQPIAWLLSACAAAVVALASRSVLRWRSTFAVLGIAGLALLPVAATGHSASNAGHDLATAVILVHVPVATAWLGTLVALLRFGAHRAGPGLAQRWRRYRRFALGCWLTLVVTGLVDAVVLAPRDTVLHSDFGRVVLVKAAVVIGIGVLGVWTRRATSRVARDGAIPKRALVRLMAVEAALLTVTLAVSVGSAHLTPPNLVSRVVGADQTLLGFDLAHAPTIAGLVFGWRVEPVMAAIALVLAVVYLVGVWRLRRRGTHWPRGRIAAWLAGCAVVLTATNSGIERYASAMFSFHIASHMLVAMLAPMLLVLGAPITLTRTSLPTAAPGRPIGFREWLDLVVDAPLTRMLTQPFVALALFVGAPFALYFTGLFDLAGRFHWAHLAIDVVFLIIGYLFAWVVVGTDPLPRPVPNLARLGLLLAAMPFDILFGAALIGTSDVIGNGRGSANMYSALALPWVRDLHADQHTAGVIAIVIGEISLLVAIAALVVQWRHGDDTDAAAQTDYDVLRTILSQRQRTPYG